MPKNKVFGQAVGGGKPVLGLSPLSARKQNEEIPSMAVL